MSDPVFISFAEGEARLDWLGLVQALAAGHQLPPAQIDDTLLYRGADTLLNRSAWIDGLGLAVKVATVFPGNKAAARPTVQGAVNLFNDHDGDLAAMLDFQLVTKWKTAADSLLAARRLAPADTRTILIVGAGSVARSLVEAYSAGFPAAVIQLWNRSAASARAVAADYPAVTVVPSLSAAVTEADIVSCATLATEPLLRGEWLRPGQHLDLIGAYRADMREADDAAIARSRLFVDSFATTLDHIGELKIPLVAGIIEREDIVADFYQLPQFVRARDDITLFKNGGGAHLDLMTSRYIHDRWLAGRLHS